MNKKMISLDFSPMEGDAVFDKVQNINKSERKKDIDGEVSTVNSMFDIRSNEKKN
jgi:hypothetical protein